MIKGGGGEAKWFCRRKQNDFAFGPFDMKMIFDQKKMTKKTKKQNHFSFFFSCTKQKKTFFVKNEK
jgi:hypothetical protein